MININDIKSENYNLKFLNETIPCGFIKYTCEKQPKVTYMNDKMAELLRFPKLKDGELDYLELYKDNIFLMVPIEDRQRFSSYLNRVCQSNSPQAGEMTLLRCDGTRAYVFGWVTKSVNDQGVEEFQSICMDITEKREQIKANQTKRYLKALTDIYDKIFEYDLVNNTVKCLYGHNSPMFKWLENIPMQLEEATEKWITATVVDGDKENFREFFKAFCKKELFKDGEKPPQITYRALSSSGVEKLYTGIFLQMDNQISLYCCKSVPESVDTDLLINENISLKENLQELVMRFTEGIAAFEVTNDYVTPLYASDNVCEFFGFSKEEWLPLMKKKHAFERICRSM